MRVTVMALVVALMLGLLPGRPAFAETPEEMILEQLETQGFHLISRNRTWLGRVMIVAESDELRREIVFNPGTGEIFRDYAVLLAVLELRDAADDGDKSAGVSGAGTRDEDPAAAVAEPAADGERVPEGAGHSDMATPGAGAAGAETEMPSVDSAETSTEAILPEPVIIDDGLGQ